MGERAVQSNTAAVGTVGELIFAAEAASRGCLPFLPVGSAKGIDVLLVTPTGRKVSVQIKAQATNEMRTVDLRTGIAADVLAVMHLDDWYLVPATEIEARLVNISQIKKWSQNWKILR